MSILFRDPCSRSRPFSLPSKQPHCVHFLLMPVCKNTTSGQNIKYHIDVLSKGLHWERSPVFSMKHGNSRDQVHSRLETKLSSVFGAKTARHAHKLTFPPPYLVTILLLFLFGQSLSHGNAVGWIHASPYQERPCLMCYCGVAFSLSSASVHVYETQPELACEPCRGKALYRLGSMCYECEMIQRPVYFNI